MKAINSPRMFFFKYSALAFFIFFISISFLGCSTDADTEKTDAEANPLVERIITDTAYGTDANQKMDIYLPAGRNDSTKVIVFIHGGGWESGSKSDSEYKQFFNLIKLKWPNTAVATINYRLTSDPTVHYAEIMADVTSAVNFLADNKVQFATSDSMYMIGASAGAHLAMLYTYKYNSKNYVKAVADFFGPAKLSDWEYYNSTNIWVGRPVKDVLIKYNGSVWDVPLYDSNSPYSVATEQSKPTIIFHGFADAIVPIYQSQWMRGKLNALNVPNEFHDDLLFGHEFNYDNMAKALDKTVVFFKKYAEKN